MIIDELLVRAVNVQPFAGEKQLSNATGFFYQQASYLYLVTNRHVVLDEANDHRPETLQLVVHTNAADLQQNEHVTVPLYSDDKPAWREHPTIGSGADVVAVPINDPGFLARHFASAFGPQHIVSPQERLTIGHDVLIVGFPLGFHDTLHNLPIVRSAVIASTYGQWFKGCAYFLTDARTHRGTSGAPVVAKMHGADDWKLLGVHSARLDVSNRDPEQDEPLGLNCAWYASLVQEMT